MERIDFVNDSLKLIQNTEGLTFGTDALLLAGYINGKFKRGCEFGGGSGIISMLLLLRDKVSKTTSLEIQEEYANLTSRNATLNGLSERLTSLCSDIRSFVSDEEFDIIYTNPPYMKTASGKDNINERKSFARHEHNGTIYDFLSSAKRLLKFGGTFAAVYRPDRLCDLIDAMRQSGIEPKKMTFVHADTESEPSMVLTLGKRGGKGGLILTKPLIIYSDRAHTKYTLDMNYIMENGNFPDSFSRA